MLRGFRWQFLALIIAIGLFVISLMARPSDSPEVPAPTQTPPTAQTATPATTEVTTPEVTSPVLQPEVVTYREGLIGSVQRLNPLFADLNPVDRDIAALIFEGLIRINRYGEPEGALAERWISSTNGLEYIFFLRQDVLWQDGLPFTAADVDFTMRLLRSPQFPGSSALPDFWRTVETEQLDTYIVRFRLTQPLGGFLDALTIGILPEHALRGITAAQLATHPFNLTPVGTGPYQLEATRSLDGSTIQLVDLRAAPSYRRRLNTTDSYAIERIRFHIYPTFNDALSGLQSGEIDGLAARNRTERSQLLATSAVVHTAYEPTVGMVIFNWDRENLPYFSEERVRRALDVGLQTAAAIERALPNLAVPASSPLVPGSWAYNAEVPVLPYDLAEAQNMLEAAEIEAQSEDVLFSFTLLTPDDPALVSIAQDIAVQWSQLGLAVSVNAVELDLYRTRLEEGDFDAAIVELSLAGGADPDVYAFWHQGQYPDGQNYGGANDTRISELLERARRDPNGINRVQLYRQFQAEFVSRAIAIPLYTPLFGYALRENVTGVQLGYIGTPADRFKTIADWRITQP